MIDTLKIYETLQKSLDPKAAKAIADILSSIYADLQNTVTKQEFNELTQVVRELAEAQKRTEVQVQQLGERVDSLAEAQERTEAQVQRLGERVDSLAEAQERTERRLEELAEAQERTERRLEKLAEAQERTEEELRQLAWNQRQMRKQLGGLSTTIGYTLENSAFKALPKLLAQEYGLKLKGKLRRQFVTDKEGHAIEVNIFGEATQNGRTVTIIGESKSQLSQKAVDEFLRKKVKRLEALYDNIFTVLVTHMTTSPRVEPYVREKGIALYFSYDF